MNISNPSQLNLKQVFLFPSSTISNPKTSSYFNSISCRAGADTLEAHRSSANLYQVLSLESDKVGFEEIKKAYRSMARQYHPDVVPASRREESTKKFVEIQRAYDTLSDPVLRRKYDLARFGGGGMMRNGQGATNFSRQAWEEQLSGLEMRSNIRKGRKRRDYV